MSERPYHRRDPDKEARAERLRASSLAERAHLRSLLADFCRSRRSFSEESGGSGGSLWLSLDAEGVGRVLRMLCDTERRIGALRASFARLLQAGEELTALQARLAQAEWCVSGALQPREAQGLPAEGGGTPEERLAALIAEREELQKLFLPFFSETLDRYAAALSCAMGECEDGSDWRLGELLAASREVLLAAERVVALL